MQLENTAAGVCSPEALTPLYTTSVSGLPSRGGAGAPLSASLDVPRPSLHAERPTTPRELFSKKSHPRVVDNRCRGRCRRIHFA